MYEHNISPFNLVLSSPSLVFEFVECRKRKNVVMAIIRLVLLLKYTGILKLLSSLSSGECRRCCLTATPLLCLLSARFRCRRNTQSLCRYACMQPSSSSPSSSLLFRNRFMLYSDCHWKRESDENPKERVETLLHICLNHIEHKSRARMSKFFQIGLKNRFQRDEKWQIGIFVCIFCLRVLVHILHCFL